MSRSATATIPPGTAMDAQASSRPFRERGIEPMAIARWVRPDAGAQGSPGPPSVSVRP
jgi:hypothetical protein